MNIHYVQDNIDSFSKRNADCLVLFLDFKKAFDSVSHSFMFELLSHMGIPDDFLMWIKILYEGAVTCV